MPSRSKLAGLLADRLDRLREAFVALHRSVRDRVAELVGTTVADVVRQTVRTALDPPTPVVPSTPPRPAMRGDPYDPWHAGEPDHWADERDPLDETEPDAWGYREPVTPPVMTPPMPTPPSPEPAVVPRIVTAVVVGLKAAAWWLATSPVRRGWGCVLAGLAAGGAGYAVGGPVGLAVAPAVAALALAGRSSDLMNSLPA
jgi:hypothetical protein